jgi:hypothetical protein
MLTALIIVLVVFAIILSLPYGVEISRPGQPVRLIIAGFRVTLKPSPERPKSASPESILSKLRALQSGGTAALNEFDARDLKVAWISLWRIVRNVRIRVHRFDLTIATEDPATTGILYGSTCVVTASLPPRWHVTVRPDFTLTSSDLAYRVDFTFIPWFLLGNCLRAIFNLPLRKMVRVFRGVRHTMRAEKVGQHV